MFAELRKRWLDYLLGGELNLENEAVRIYIDGLNRKASESWGTMIRSDVESRDRLWEDLNLEFIEGIGIEARIRSNNITKTYCRLKDMALAWGTKGSIWYHNEEMKTEMICGLDFMNHSSYGSSDTEQPFFGNWWDWEIGSPIALMDIALILYDELTDEQKNNYAAASDRFTNNCEMSSGYGPLFKMTGANLMDKATAVVQVGILTYNGAKLEYVRNACKAVFQYVTEGDGFYRDGSYIQHNAIAYIGGYGLPLYEKISLLSSILTGTEYALVYEDHAEQIAIDMIFEGCEPFLYNALCMNMVAGRSITRIGSSDKEVGVDLLNATILMGDAMSAEQRGRFNSMVKYLIGVDEDYYFKHTKNIAALMKADSIMRDDSIKPREGYVFHKMFGGMDKLVHIMPEYAFGVSMHSSRTFGHELINDEGKQTWNLSDGMTYLYNEDRDQFGGTYWATVNPMRLPGTTTEYVIRPKGAGSWTTNLYSWVGGSTVGNYGAAGMHFRTLGSTGDERTGADAKKSWFLFDDEIVAMGSNITSSTGNRVETIVENRKLKADGSNMVIVDGEVKEIRDDGPECAEKGTALSDVSWIALEGNTENSGIGYYFPRKADLMALKEKRTRNWSAQGRSEGEETDQFATFWFEHGSNPVDASYSYVILPGRGAEEMKQYAAEPKVEVLECSEDAHAARKEKLGITAVNFWNDKEKTVAGITSDRAASVTVQVRGGEICVGVADPTQENEDSIQISVPYAGGDVIAADENIEVLQKAPFIRLAVRTAGMAGGTSVIRLKM